MKTRRYASLLFVIALAVGCAVGCTSAFTNRAKETSYPVQVGAASTNDSQAVAYLELAEAFNRKFTPPPYQAPVSGALWALIGLASAAGGFIARHHVQRKDP